MEIIEVATRLRKTIIIDIVENKDYEALTKRRYSFNWKSLKNSATVYKLQIEGNLDILGVMGLIDVPNEKRIEIKLLASAKENIGKNKVYDRIAGCLIAFACRLALSKYGLEASVSLIPKTELASYYMQKYYMKNAGWQVFLDGKNLIKLINEYI